MNNVVTLVPLSSVPGTRRRRSRLLSAVAAAAFSFAGLGAAGTAAAQSSTTVSPAGEALTATLVSGTKATFVVGSVQVGCANSSTTGGVPAAPANHNDAGPVASPLAPASFSSNGGACSTNVLFTTATTTTSGDWGIALQFDPAGSTGTLSIPQGGVVTKTKGLASCTITAAPDAPLSVVGTWVNGTDTAAPQLVISSAAVPIKVTGGLGCPTNATSALFSATYDVTSASGAIITVAP